MGISDFDFSKKSADPFKSWNWPRLYWIFSKKRKSWYI